MKRKLKRRLKTPATAAVIQTAPPVTRRRIAATPQAPLQMTATAAVTVTTTAPRHLPPPHLRLQTAQAQGAVATQIRDLQRRRKRRNK